ncbi:lipid-A-disaccharide synthase [Arenicellales bacterium IMCC58067]
MDSILRLGLVAAEPSGDRLGAGVVDALRRKGVSLDLVGIGGPELVNRGLTSRCDIHDLSMMGIDDIFRKLPKAFNVRRKLLGDLKARPPHVFLGIDAPDFNLSLERKLKSAGYPVLHLVSPTVWAWRQYRVRKIRKAVDRMLVLFPFEEAFYSARGIPATFVGHPAATEMKLVDKHSARAQLGFKSTQKIVAILPGSRESEIRGLGKIFMGTIHMLSIADPDLEFVLPFASSRVRKQFFEYVPEDQIPSSVRMLDGQARVALAASDVALLASGTAALEAALAGCPMVVAYRVSNVSYRLARLLAKTKIVSMPNHLVDPPIVAEFLQHDATPRNLMNAVRELLDQPGQAEAMRSTLLEIQTQLDMDTNNIVADEVLAAARGFQT